MLCNRAVNSAVGVRLWEAFGLGDVSSISSLETWLPAHPARRASDQHQRIVSSLCREFSDQTWKANLPEIRNQMYKRGKFLPTVKGQNASAKRQVAESHEPPSAQCSSWPKKMLRLSDSREKTAKQTKTIRNNPKTIQTKQTKQQKQTNKPTKNNNTPQTTRKASQGKDTETTMAHQDHPASPLAPRA